LEVLVHIRNVNAMPDFVYSLLIIPDKWIEQLEGGPVGHRERWIQARIESPVLSREAGDMWIRERRQFAGFARLNPPETFRHPRNRRPVLQVPSIVIPQESNFLLDPEDEEIKTLAWSKPESFRFDPRLLDPSLREDR
jgi:hypothetical protein